MSGQRMEITKEALKLFIKSLPVGCTFAILGFGSTSEFIQPALPNSSQMESDVVWRYDDKSLPTILYKISKLQADFGGTNILSPLILATDLEIGDKKRIIFLLTDGEVDDK